MIKLTTKATLNHNVFIVWNTITNKNDYAWRSNLEKIYVFDEFHFVEFSKNFLTTDYKINHIDEYIQYELELDNKNIKGFLFFILKKLPNDSTEIEIIQQIEVKNPLSILFTRANLEKAQVNYIEDLKKKLDLLTINSIDAIINGTQKEILAKSLTADKSELIPYLPYLLQDLWELGSNPKLMINLIKKYVPYNENARLLDLACGKGAVAINVAKELDFYVKGIDIMPEFIQFANEKIKEYQLKNIIFEVNDINRSISTEKYYDVVIYGAVGNVLGNPKKTLTKLNSTIKEEGFIMIDDAYLLSDNESIHNTNYQYLTLGEWKQIFEESQLTLVDFIESNEEESNQTSIEMIKKRAEDLIIKHPEHTELFHHYIALQVAECKDLECNVQGFIAILRKPTKIQME